MRHERVIRRDALNVFQMRVDVDRFQYFLTDPITDYRRLYMDGSPVGDQWVPPKVYVQYPKKPVGDFYNANYSVFIASAHATETLYKHFKWAGELLPLPYKEQTFYAAQCDAVH